MLVFAAFLSLVALLSNTSFGPHQVPWRLSFPYFFPSWIGRLFALPLALISIAGGAFTHTADNHEWVATGLFLLAGVAFLIAHLRNHLGGMELYRFIRPHVGNPSLPAAPLWSGLWPLATGSRGTVRLSSIAYGPDPERNLLDVIKPARAIGEPMPVLIHVHGGAWVMGNKNQQAKPLIHHLAKAGWLCIDINYRLGPKHRLPAMLTDVLLAIKWARENARAHGGDPGFIAITGGSAGGHLASMAALTHDQAWLKPGFEAADCSVQAAVPLYFPIDLLDRNGLLGKNAASVRKLICDMAMPADQADDTRAWDAMSPITQVRADAPPLLMIAARSDNLIPQRAAAVMADALQKAGAKGSLAFVLSGAQHAFENFSSASAHYHINAVRVWLDTVRAQLQSRPVETREPSA